MEWNKDVSEIFWNREITGALLEHMKSQEDQKGAQKRLKVGSKIILETMEENKYFWDFKWIS